MAGPNIISGALPNIATGGTVTGWFVTDADATSLELSIPGLGGSWTSSIPVSGGTIAFDSTNPQKTSRLLPITFTEPTNTGQFTLNVRAVGPGGTGPSFPFTVRIYQGGGAGVLRTYKASAETLPLTPQLEAIFPADNGRWVALLYGAAAATTIDGVSFPLVNSSSLRRYIIAYGADGVPISWVSCVSSASGMNQQIVAGLVAGTDDIAIGTWEAGSNSTATWTWRGKTHATLLTVTNTSTSASNKRPRFIRFSNGGTTLAFNVTSSATISSSSGTTPAFGEVTDEHIWMVVPVATGSYNTTYTTITLGGKSIGWRPMARLIVMGIKVSDGTAAVFEVRETSADMSSSQPYDVYGAGVGGAASPETCYVAIRWRLTTTGSFQYKILGFRSTGENLVSTSQWSSNTAGTAGGPVPAKIAVSSEGVYMASLVTTADTLGTASTFTPTGSGDLAITRWSLGLTAAPTLVARTSGTGAVSTRKWGVQAPTYATSYGSGPLTMLANGLLALAFNVTGAKSVVGTNTIAANSEAAIDGFLATIETNGSASATIRGVGKTTRGAVSVDDYLACPVPGAIGGGVLIGNHTADTASSTASYTPAASTTNVTVATGTPTLTVVNFDSDAVFYRIDALTDVPPGDFGYIAPPDPVAMAAWPTTGTEDNAVSAIATSRNPQDPNGLLPYPGTAAAAVDVDGTVTAAPAPVTGTARNGAVVLSWAALAGVRGYRIYRDGFLAAQVLGAATTSYTMTGLVNGTTYNLAVAGFTSTSEGPTNGVSIAPSSSGGTVTSATGQWSSYRIEAFDTIARKWFTTPLGVDSQWQDYEIDGADGRGKFRIEPHNPATHTNPAAFDYIPPYGARVTFTPKKDWNGQLVFLLRAVAVTPEGVELVSANRIFGTTFAATYDPPEDIAGDMPDIDEDGIATGTFTSYDPDGSALSWQLSPVTTDPGALSTRPTSTTSIRVWPSSFTGTGVPLTGSIGTLSIISGQGSTSGTAQLRFTPDSNWHGSYKFAVRAGDGGDGLPGGNPGWTSWRTVTGTVEAVADPPSALSPTSFPAVAEDSFGEQVFTWSDVDLALATSPGSYELQLALNSSPVVWLSYDEGESIDLGDVVLTVVEVNSDTTSTRLRVEPKANFWGDYSVLARIKDTSDGDPVYGPAATLTGTITSVPDAPALVTPGTMPRAKAGQSVFGTFSTTDPDLEDVTWVFTISDSSGGTYATTMTIPGIGTLTVVDTATSDKEAMVRLDAAGNGFGRYSFWIKATDSAGMSSPPARVLGYVSAAQVGVTLQRVIRTETDANIVPLCPLSSVSRLTLTDALDGPGGATCVVTALELSRKAAALGMSVAELLDPSRVELRVSIGGEPVWVGPISGHDFDAADPAGAVAIYATGLLGYFEGRLVETPTGPLGTRDFINTDQSAIVWALIDESQQADYGHLALTDGTTPAALNSTVALSGRSTVLEALGEIGGLADAPEVWIDPDRTVRSAQTRGQDRRDRVRITHGAVTRVGRSTSWDDIVTVAVVVGAENPAGGNFSGTYADTTAMAKRGRVTRVVEAPQLLSDAACTALAREIVLRSMEPTESYGLDVDVNPGRPWTLTDVEVGDVVTLDILDEALGRVLADVRVVSRSVELVGEAPDSFRVSLAVETAVYVDGRLQGSRSRHVAELYDQMTEALYR